MIKHLFILIPLCSLMACDQSAQSTLKDPSTPVAVVGDYQITEAYLNAYLTSQGLQQPTAEQSNQALDELIKQVALTHQAKVAGLQLPLVQSLLIEQAKHRALAQLAVEQHLLNNPVTEAQIEAEYQRITAELKGEEYRVSHLLFQDEAQAIQTLDQINAGQSYLTVESEYMLQHAQVKNVGDIGWVNLMQVPEAFRLPLQNMTEQTVFPEVLVSQFGAHVLYLADKRALQAPEFATVKPGIKKSLEQQVIDRYQQLAVIKAKVKVK